jgi:3-oxoacyl-[acyl-carrier protein] reductase
MEFNSRLLSNKTAFVTGSSKGIGWATIKLLAQNGANIIAHARLKNKIFEENLNELSQNYSVIITPIYFDLNSENEIKTSLNILYQNKIVIDILVNNAGLAHGGFLKMTSINNIKDVFQINFFSHLYLIQVIIKFMKKSNNASIINISSIAGIDAEAGSIAYGSSKAALIYSTKVLAKEFASDCIRVNAVAPGLTDTGMALQMELKAKSKMLENSAMGRMASPEEIAQTVLFLASDMSNFVNGQIIRVDGGM